MRHPLHDYRGGGYFVTFVTYKRKPLLGVMNSGSVRLTDPGTTVFNHWQRLPTHFPGLVLDEITIMPDHVHCILIIVDPQLTNPELTGKPQQRVHLSRVMLGWKTYSAIEINRRARTEGNPVWQKGYIDRIIRSSSELEKFRNYIATNPMRACMPR